MPHIISVIYFLSTLPIFDPKTIKNSLYHLHKVKLIGWVFFGMIH